MVHAHVCVWACAACCIYWCVQGDAQSHSRVPFLSSQELVTALNRKAYKSEVQRALQAKMSKGATAISLFRCRVRGFLAMV